MLMQVCWTLIHSPIEIRMQQLSGQDAMFLHAELEGLPQHIGGVNIYDQSTAPNGKVPISVWRRAR